MAQRSGQGSIDLGRLQWLERILARLPGALMVFDADHRFKLALGAIMNPPGEPPEDVLGKTYEEHLREHGHYDPARVERMFSALSGKPSIWESWLGPNWFEVRTEPLFDEGGSVGGVLALALDATDRKLAQVNLNQREQLLRLAAAQAPMLLQMRDADLRLTFLAGKLASEIGIDPQAAIGTRFEIVPGTADPDHPTVREHWAALRGRSSDPIHFEIAGRIIEARVKPLRGDTGIVGTVGVWVDVTEQRRAEHLLQQRYAQLELAASHTPSALWAISKDGILTMLTGRVVETLGWDASKMVGKHVTEAMEAAGAADPEGRSKVHLAALDGQPRSFETTWGSSTFTLHMRPLTEPDGSVSGIVGLAYDITQLKEAGERTAYLATYDVLTGIPNRTLLRELLAQGLEVSRRHSSAAAVAALDLDDFKRVNDTLGLDVGDRLLAAVAKRLTSVLGPGDSISRSSGDEFIIVRPDFSDPHQPEELTRALLGAFETPFQINAYEIFMRASIGVSVYPNDGESADDLLAHADAALIHAKQHSRGEVQFFHRSLQAAIVERISLEADLRRAIERREFELHYQPIVDVSTKQIAGAEALVRWNHPMRGMVPPDSFIGICEESGLITSLGAWVLDAACDQASEWCGRNQQDFFVSINVSPRQLDSDLEATLRGCLDKSGVKPGCIELEFTETAVIRDAQVGIMAMRRLQNLGVRISIDDFGTGYSSLAYLKRLPVNSLKIDRLFVRDIAVSPYDAAIARAIIALAQSIDLRVIAEGVETQEQCDLLEALGCRFMQGYFFSRPMPAAKFFNGSGRAWGDGPPHE